VPTKSVDRPVIGLSANVVDPRLTRGRIDGIGTYTLAQERELKQLGMPTRRIYAPSFARGHVTQPPTNSLAFRQPVALSVAATSLFGIPMVGAASVEAVIDIYHATDYMVPRLRHTPVVATVHDAIPLSNPEWANARLRGLKNLIIRAGVQRADLVIAISRAIVPEIVEHYAIPESRVRVIPLGVDRIWSEEPLSELVEDALSKYGLVPGYFLFVGTLQPRKNVIALLRAYDRLPPRVRDARQLVIVGRFGWGVDKLRLELIRRRVKHRCVWLEYVDRDALRCLYSGAGAFVFPSLAEGFGLPVLEALSAGLPVVATDLPVLREVAGSMAEFTAPSDIDALSEAMARAVEAAVSAAVVGARRAHARAFDWRTCAVRTVEVYREVMEAR
jgi:glycosyltransferase involved in cell wall biosynthesis